MIMNSRLINITGVALLAGALIFLYQMSSAVDAKQQILISNSLRKLHQLDEQLGQYILLARMRQLQNYDPLVQTQHHIQNLSNQIAGIEDIFGNHGDAGLRGKFKEYLASSREKEILVERFKSQNAVLHNSISYFPQALHSVLDDKGHLPDGDPMEVEVRDHLMHDMLVYQVTPNDALQQAIHDSMTRIVSSMDRYPSYQREQLGALLTHSAIMLAYQEEITRTMQELFKISTGEHLETIFDLYSQHFERAERTANIYRFWLLLFAASGLIYGVYSLLRINRARERLDRSLTELEFQKYALDQHSIVSITDRSGRIIYANDKFSEISQYSRDELYGKDHRMLNSGAHPSEFFKQMWATIGKGIVWKGPVKNRRKDGSCYWVDSTIVPFMDEMGKPERYVSIRTDITERVAAEEAMKAALDAAESASRAKSDFLANMSHEIRTPMNGIIGMTELALDTDLDREQQEYIGLVKSSADSLLTIINDILDFSKIEAGKLDIEMIEFDLHDLMSQTAHSIAFKAHQKGLELLFRIDESLPSLLRGDPGRIRQIMINLIGNAIKFTEQGEIEISVSPSKIRTGEGTVGIEVRVRDTGIGIPVAKQHAIFESFSQADTSTTRRYGGTGLGLTITQRLASLMRGKVWVESEPGKGSTFHVEMVLDAPSQEAVVCEATASLAGKRALVVDDNATNRALATEMLQKWGMHPDAVDRGASTIEVLERAAREGTPYDLMLLDMQMPDMDGFQVAEHLQAHPDLKVSSVMMLTSEGRRGDADRCRQLGIAAYLHKPMIQSELFEAITIALSDGNGQRRPLITRHSLRQNRTKLRILLAEDNRVNQTLATRLLAKFGHAVVVANNGLEAIDLWQSDRFDLILMDVDMPELNGLDATARIRALEHGSAGRIPIIGLTAHAMQGSREQCLAAGMDGYVSKPIDTESLWKELENVKGGATPDAALPSRSIETKRFDLRRALRAIGDERALFEELSTIFLNDYPAYLERLRVAIDAGDTGQIRYLSHTLKGMLSVFAVSEVADIAERIETQVGADHRQDYTLLADGLEWLGRELQVVSTSDSSKS
jgi:two-component system sensor histidine kinase/response regulator